MNAPKTELEKSTTDLTSECREVKPVILRPEDVEQIAASLSDQELIAKVTSTFHNLRDNLPYLREARNRFAKPGQRVPVANNPTWTEWVTTNLGKSVRTVQRWLEEPKPKQEKKPRKIKPLKDWPQAQRRINDFVTAVQQLQTKTPVKGSDTLIPALRDLAAIAGCQLLEPSKPLPEAKLPRTVVPGETPSPAEDGKSRPSKPDPNTNRVAADKGWGTDARGKSFFQGKEK